MQNDKNLTEAQLRRKRINLYKKVILAILIILILTPSVLCMFLFAKIIRLEKKLNQLMIIHNLEVVNNTTIPDYVYAHESEGETFSEQYAEYESDIPETDSAPDASAEDVPSKEVESLPPESETIETGDKKLSDSELVEIALSEGRKVVYLTFDDGPSDNTENILDILDTYGVKATFFTIGDVDEKYDDLYNEIIVRGNSLGMHSYSHKYNEIYASLDAFRADFSSVHDKLYEITGQDISLYRFPGGSSNLVSLIPMTEFIKYLNSNNVTYFDWNSSAQDAEGEPIPTDVIIENVFKDIDKKDICVVLMHDANHLTTTVEALPQIIERLQAMNALILPITDTTTLIQHVSSDSVQ